MTEFTPLEIMVVEHKVRAMFNGRDEHFSICDIDNLAKVLRITLDSREYNALRLLHCVDWGDMSKPLREEVRRSVLRILQMPNDEHYVNAFADKLKTIANKSMR